MNLTLDDVLGKDFQIFKFEHIFFNTILNCIEQRFIEGDDSRIVDMLIHPNENFAGYFKITIRKQIVDTFDITSHMVYTTSKGIKDRYISTIYADFTATDKSVINETSEKLTKLTDQLSKLLHTVQKDFKCTTFHITLKEFEIADYEDVIPNTGILQYEPFIGDSIEAVQECMSTIINEYILRGGMKKSSRLIMNSTLDIECTIDSINQKSTGKLVFIINHMANTNAIQFCIISVPFIEKGKDRPYGLAIVFSSPKSGFAKGGICLTILEAEIFGNKYMKQDKEIMGYIADYINCVAQEVDNGINLLSNNHKITINVETEVL